MTQVSVVAGTYNRLPLLKAMVQSARQSAKDLSLEIVLVDGGSTDGTLEWCKSQPDITLLEHGELLGAIKAYNDGCAAASGDYVTIGNDDITFDNDTIHRAYQFLQTNPEVGQAAFGHKFQRRNNPDQARVQGAFGFTYGQCCMTPRWLGDKAGWWGTEGMRTYGGDTRFSLRLWEMGWPVVQVQGCSVTDHEHEDELRELNSDSPWRNARVNGKIHPDLEKFNRTWPRKRLPDRGDWIPAPARRVLKKAMSGNLRTMRFKSGMFAGAPTRTALIDAFGAYGPTRQVNQTDAMKHYGKDEFQGFAKQMVQDFEPDLILFQVQRENNVTPQTVKEIRQEFPWTFTVNWDGDTHYPITPFHIEIAKAVHLQLIVSPSWFPVYAGQGVGVGYWPIGIEQEYCDQERLVPDGPDVLFTGALYGEGVFPEAEFRRDAVLAMSKSGLDFGLYGPGWPRVGLETKSTSEAFTENAMMMAKAKMTLSISQSSDLWGYTSDRLYNITATGCPALVQRFSGMEQHGYVDGETCIAFGTIDEMLEKAWYYVDPIHSLEREDIGARGKKMTLARHTWAHRIEGLFAMLEGLP